MLTNSNSNIYELVNGANKGYALFCMCAKPNNVIREDFNRIHTAQDMKELEILANHDNRPNIIWDSDFQQAIQNGGLPMKYRILFPPNLVKKNSEFKEYIIGMPSVVYWTGTIFETVGGLSAILIPFGEESYGHPGVWIPQPLCPISLTQGDVSKNDIIDLVGKVSDAMKEYKP